MEAVETGSSDEHAQPSDPRSVLLLAPVRSDERDRECHRHLASDRTPLKICNLNFRHSMGRKVTELTDWGGELSMPVSMIYARDRSDHGSDPRDQVPEGVPLTVEAVTAPSDLTSIGVSLTDVVDEASAAGAHSRICVDSLTTLLQYVELSAAIKFINVTNTLVEDADSHIHYHLDPRAHDETVVATLEQVVDEVVTVRDDGAV
ncbi:hypothetical protein GRX01_05220 [Halobaculum sp. WSA2]|uniref:Uncharacterized protein n=1 Tax=Halobaculum saliterrae TaxID=2073113 RepID=A0A6B0SVU4_9EURY|nr:hypothetical protein [Halobaculum saliterrae]MXR40743.1 hypothetical protein [Halobaculum saliterrae]